MFPSKTILTHSNNSVFYPIAYSAHCPQAAPQEEEGQDLPPPRDQVPPLQGQHHGLLRLCAHLRLLRHSARFPHRASGNIFPRTISPSHLSFGTGPHSSPPEADRIFSQQLISIYSMLAVCVLADSYTIIFLFSRLNFCICILETSAATPSRDCRVKNFCHKKETVSVMVLLFPGIHDLYLPLTSLFFPFLRFSLFYLIF